MRLLLDLGNTRLKWALAGGGGAPERNGALAWAPSMPDDLVREWRPLSRPRGVWAASVVDGAREAALSAAVLARFGLPVNWVRTPHEACGVTTAYADPSAMGVDRFLGLVAAHADGHAPCVLVSSGTALVLDALAASGRHLGGWIAPGAALMQQSVLGATARVRPREPGRLTEAATTTADALTSGSWHACAALTDRFIERMRARLGGHPRVLLGGGDADALGPLLEHAAQPYPDAVLKGLATWARREA